MLIWHLDCISTLFSSRSHASLSNCVDCLKCKRCRPAPGVKTCESWSQWNLMLCQWCSMWTRVQTNVCTRTVQAEKSKMYIFLYYSLTLIHLSLKHIWWITHTFLQRAYSSNNLGLLYELVRSNYFFFFNSLISTTFTRFLKRVNTIASLKSD